VNPDRSCRTTASILLFAALLLSAAPSAAQQDATPDLRAIVETEASDLAGVVSRYSADREALLRRWDGCGS
jgi:hypothetical protein